MSESQQHSDLSSFSNDSESTTYEGPHGHIAESSSKALHHLKLQFEPGIIELVSRLEAKAEEITDLKVAVTDLQSEFEKKDEVCQRQALKIKDLQEMIASLRQEIKSLNQFIANWHEEISISLHRRFVASLFMFGAGAFHLYRLIRKS